MVGDIGASRQGLTDPRAWSARTLGPGRVGTSKPRWGSKRARLRSARKAGDADRDRPEWVERVGQRHPVVAVRDLGAIVERDD